MKALALIAALALVAACGAQEETTPDTGKTPTTDTMKKSAGEMADKAPESGAAMRTVTLDISGMT